MNRLYIHTVAHGWVCHIPSDGMSEHGRKLVLAEKYTLKGQVMDHITKHDKELPELQTKVETLTGEIERLKNDIREQENQITDQNVVIKDLKSKYKESTKVNIIYGYCTSTCIYIGSQL